MGRRKLWLKLVGEILSSVAIECEKAGLEKERGSDPADMKNWKISGVLHTSGWRTFLVSLHATLSQSHWTPDNFHFQPSIGSPGSQHGLSPSFYDILIQMWCNSNQIIHKFFYSLEMAFHFKVKVNFKVIFSTANGNG